MGVVVRDFSHNCGLAYCNDYTFSFLRKSSLIFDTRMSRAIFLLDYLHQSSISSYKIRFGIQTLFYHNFPLLFKLLQAKAIFSFSDLKALKKKLPAFPSIQKLNTIILCFLLIILTGCIPAIVALGAGAVGAGVAASKVKNKEGEPEKSQLEIREIQTRTYDTPDSKMVLKTMLNVLQDDGFIVTEGNADLGLLSATKELDVQTEGAVFWGSFFNLAWDKNAIVEATANVSEFGKQTRVRVNFQQKVYDSAGGVSTVDQIADPKFYQEFFAKVDKGLFIQQEKL